MTCERPVRVLVVEDEAMVAMLIEDMLEECGYEVVGPALHLEGALPLAREADIQLAVLDVNLGTARSYPVADVLRERRIPFIFATGYGSAGLADEYRNLTVTLKKPFDASELSSALQQVLNR